MTSLTPSPAWAWPSGLLLLTALALLLAYHVQQPRLQADIGGSWDQGFVSAFGGRESNADTSFRWSGALSALHLYGFEGRPTLLRMRLSATRPADAEPARMRLDSQGQALGEWRVDPGWREYSLLLPPQPGSEQTLLLRSSTFSPGGRDSRSLGVALDQLHGTSLALPRPALPPPIRWLFLSLLPPTLLIALTRSRHSRRLALPAALGLSALLVLGIAAWPVATGYLLPNLWPTLGLLALALLLPPLRAAMLRVLPAPSHAESLSSRLHRAVLALALLLLVGGLTLLAEQVWTAGAALAIPGALLLALGFVPAGDLASEAWPTSTWKKGRLPLGLTLLTMLALGLRLWQLDRLPLGIWQDEARHGMYALDILRDPSFRPVYASDADLPAGVFYLIAPAFQLFDVSPWSLRLPLAVAGSLLPLALYSVARPLLGSATALLGAALIACASWSLSLSRIAWPTILDPLLLLLALGLLWRALHTRRTWRCLAFAALAGLLNGLGAYTYHTGRLAALFGLWMLIVVVLEGTGTERIDLLKAGQSKPRAARYILRSVLCALIPWAVVLALTTAPLVGYARQNPQGFSKRVGGVALLGGSQIDSGSPATLIEANALRYLGMLHVAGDPNGRHHLPGLPLLDPLVGTLFLVGLLWALLRCRQAAAALLLGWLALGMVAGVFSVGGPHAMRAVGALAPSLLLAAIGLRELIALVVRESPHKQGGAHHTSPHKTQWLFLAVLLVIALLNSWLYFGLMPSDPQHVRAFRPVATRIGFAARQLAQAEPGRTVYLPAGQLEADETRLFTVGVQNIRSLADAPPEGSGSAAVLLLPAEASAAERDEALTRLRMAGVAGQPGELAPDTDQPLYWIYSRR